MFEAPGLQYYCKGLRGVYGEGSGDNNPEVTHRNNRKFTTREPTKNDTAIAASETVPKSGTKSPPLPQDARKPPRRVVYHFGMMKRPAANYGGFVPGTLSRVKWDKPRTP